MEKLKKAFQTLLNVIELYIPMIMFSALFIAFILQIVSRYLFRSPLVWPYELAQIGYVWVILLGAGYCSRTDDHIVFSVVYESAVPLVKRIFDIISDVLIIGLFVLTIPALISFYQFFFTRFSTVFRVPLGVVYFPFAIYTVSCIARSIIRLIKHLRSPLDTPKQHEAIPAQEEETVHEH